MNIFQKANERAEARAAMLQGQLDDNAPFEFYVNGKKYKTRRLTNYVAEKLSKLVSKCEYTAVTREDTPGETLKAIAMNRKMVPKCLSLLILAHPVKVWLFHCIYWRYLHFFGNQADYAGILENALNSEEVGFFFRNMASLQANNMLTVEMTKASTKSIAQKHASEPERT